MVLGTPAQGTALLTVMLAMNTVSNHLVTAQMDVCQAFTARTVWNPVAHTAMVVMKYQV